MHFLLNQTLHVAEELCLPTTQCTELSVSLLLDRILYTMTSLLKKKNKTITHNRCQ